MEQNRMENDTGRFRLAYVAPQTEVYCAGPCSLLESTNFGTDPGSVSFGEYFGGGGNAGEVNFGSSFSGGGSSGGGAGSAKGLDFGVTFSDVWEE
jgi:hypothetical protein